MLETWISLVIYLIEQYLVLAFHLTQDGVIGETSSFGETPGSSCHAVRPRGCDAPPPSLKGTHLAA